MSEGEPILDASALLAYLRVEPGAEVVTDALAEGAIISSVNLTEALAKAMEWGWQPEELTAELERRGILFGALLVEEFTFDDSIEAARLRPLTRHLGLSLADRACLALARRTEFPILTADTAWSELDVGVRVEQIR